MNISCFKDLLKWQIVVSYCRTFLTCQRSLMWVLTTLFQVFDHSRLPGLLLVVFEEHLSRLDELIIRRLVQTTTRQSVLCNRTLCAVCVLYAVCPMLCAICCVLCAVCYVLPFATYLWQKGISAEDSWRHWNCSITWCKGPYICAPIYHSYKIHNLSPSCRCVHRAVCDLDCS